MRPAIIPFANDNPRHDTDHMVAIEAALLAHQAQQLAAWLLHTGSPEWAKAVLAAADALKGASHMLAPKTR